MQEPKFEEYMYPILKIMEDSKERTNAEIRSAVLKFMNLKKEDFVLRQKNGNYKYSDNINFAASYLSMAGLLNRKSRGSYQISKEGLQIVSNPSITYVSEKYLKEINPEFRERINAGNRKKKTKETEELIDSKLEELNPLEKIENEEVFIKETVKDNLLSTIKSLDPFDFERLCLKLLLSLEYGYDTYSGHVTQKSGDGGIDGIIFGDKLGLEKIAYQSKLWNKTVERGDVSQFITDFDYAKCVKGVFITTSKFSSGAIKLAENRKDLVLINGDRLTELMYEHDVGVYTKTVIKIKELDLDFFNDFA